MREARRESDAKVWVGTALDAALEWAVRLASVTVVGALVIIGVQLFGGTIFTVDAANSARHLETVDTITLWWLYASVLIAVIWAVRRTDKSEEQWGYILIYGVVMWFGLPFLVRMVGETKSPVGWQNQPVEILLRRAVLVGQITLATLIVPTLRMAAVRIWARAELKASQAYKAASQLKREAPKSGGRPHVLSPCWKLPYCRDYLLSVCPAYKARRRCWKYKSGCFCDSTMLENMITGVKGASAGQQAYMRTELDARNAIAKQRTRRPPCRRCFIYLEHEELKFQALAPLVYPVVVLAVIFGFEPYIKPSWNWIQETLGGLWARLALTDKTFDIMGRDDVFGNTIVAYALAVIFAMVLILALQRLTEVWCFKWKL